MRVTCLQKMFFWDIKKKFTPVTCPIWGHVFGSKKSKKSDPQSRFPSKLDFQKSSFCSNNPYTFIYTLLSADNRTTRHHLCDLLLKIDEFWNKILGGNPIWGQNFSKFSLPETSPHHTKKTGEKNFQKNELPYRDLEFKCSFDSFLYCFVDNPVNIWVFV